MTLDRRTFLGFAAAGLAAGALAACGASEEAGPSDESPSPSTASSSSDPGVSTDPTSSEATTPAANGNEPETTSSTETGRGTVGTWVVRGADDTDQVALTFHTDGPTSMVTQVLDLVEARDLVITTFIVGSWLEANSSMGARIVDGGHDIANHTTTHPGFETLTPSQMTTEIEGCRDVLEQVTGTPGRWFRPSGTDNGIDSPSAATLAAAGAAGYTVIGYDIDPLDYKDPGAHAVRDRTLAATVGGSIVSLHMGHPGTIEALPAILDGLASRGLKPVSLATLLG